MKSFKTVLVTVAMTAVAAGSLLAQTESSTANTLTGRHGRRAAMLSAHLGLSDQQKQEAQTIFQNSKTSAQPIRQQLKQTRQAVQAAIQAGKSPAEVQQLAQSEGPQLAQLAGIRASASAQFYAILTPDQQQKMATLRQNLRHHKGAQTATGTSSN